MLIPALCRTRDGVVPNTRRNTLEKCEWLVIPTSSPIVLRLVGSPNRSSPTATRSRIEY
jgi:hypothetical protein